MNQLVIIENQQAVTSSIQVAKSFEKQHAHVLRQIDELKKDVSNFGEIFFETEISDKYGRLRRAYLMNRDGFTLLAMGFTGTKALQFKLAYINAFKKMEEQFKQMSLPSYQISDPIARAQKWIEEQQQAQQVALEMEAAKPKLEYVDKVLQSDTLLTATQIAKEYGISAKHFNKVLHDLKFHYQMRGVWMPYQKYAGEDYTKIITTTIETEYGIKTRHMSKWTEKGRQFVYELFKENGIYPVHQTEEDDYDYEIDDYDYEDVDNLKHTEQ